MNNITKHRACYTNTITLDALRLLIARRKFVRGYGTADERNTKTRARIPSHPVSMHEGINIYSAAVSAPASNKNKEQHK